MQVLSVFIVCLGIIFFSPNLNEKSEMSLKALRLPASNDSSCLELIRDFYPNQSDEFLKNRIMNNKDVHSMYRAFVPLFYKEFFDHPKKMKALGELNNFIASISGDAHFENFGFIIDETGVVRFTINDVDDSTKGPLYFDVFRLYISSHFLDKKIEWEDFLSAYTEGVKNKKREYSSAVREKLETALLLRDDFIKGHVSSSPPYKFIKLKTPNRKMTNDEGANLLAALKTKFPQITIHDQYARIKVDGGSAGMLRFQVLASLSPNTPPRWMDIKEMGTSSKDKVFNATSPLSPEERIKNVKRDVYKGKMENSLTTIKLGQTTFSLRYIEQFAVGVSASDLEKNQIIDVALDEAHALGSFHAQSLAGNGQSTSAYLSAWDKVNKDEARDIADNIHDHFKDLFKNAQ